MRLGGVIFLLCLFPFMRLSGQNVDTYPEGGVVPFKDRIAIRTNVVDWVLTTPNVAFDYDIVSTPYDKQSIGLGLKYNWNTRHTYIPKQVYNLFDLRADYRFYWRQQPYDDREEDWERQWLSTAKGWDKLRARINCFRAVENPKPHISIFAGPYLSVSSFSIKLGVSEKSLGRQGTAFGAGLTGGIALPLYGYENGSALDVEFGGSVGWHFASYDLYKADIESNDYPLQGHRNRFVFFPLVTDARVSLVYRFRSIAKQHTEIDYDLIDRRYIAHLMEGDKEKVNIYNDSISQFKEVLDQRNHEIALYKQAEESKPGFNQAYALEYLTPYVNMLEAPRKYTRYNKDTLPKIHIDSMEQITDYILLRVRESIDSIPHVTSAQVDAEFIKQYNGISDNPSKRSLNRTELIKNIYNQINTYFIEENNAKLVSGTFGAEVLTEKVYKFNAKQQNRPLVEIAYKDSVRTVEMTYNEKVEWRNSIKKKAWADAQRRMQGDYPGRVIVDPINNLPTDTVVVDSIAADSVKIDSVKTDSIGGEGVSPLEATSADEVVATAISHVARMELYALRSEEYAIKEEDDEE